MQAPSGEHRQHDQARAHPQPGAPADDAEPRDDRSDRSERNLGLSLTDLVCFAHVAEAGDTPVTAGDLATRAHVTTGAVTGILNRLERGGFVHRRPDPADRRRVHVTAVPAAAERVRAVFGPYHQLLTESLAGHSPDEIALIAGWLDRAVELTRRYVEESC
ncbi:MarR family winged helix-turn-helix transcriptional regulator [Streptomyces sp. NPDC101133]|uniref:MarR family winged helix-turn-helix transcriptional regulator n=1 Tax=Streptomyces sp. NPDC101133 TaxID=3366111 RepID=UPI0037FDA9F8